MAETAARRGAVTARRSGRLYGGLGRRAEVSGVTRPPGGFLCQFDENRSGFRGRRLAFPPCECRGRRTDLGAPSVPPPPCSSLHIPNRPHVKERKSLTLAAALHRGPESSAVRVRSDPGDGERPRNVAVLLLRGNKSAAGFYEGNISAAAGSDPA